MGANKSYRAKDIEVLEGLEPVRKRPGMYIGGTDTIAGLHQLVTEIVDNSVDEAMNGFATEIRITLHSDGESVSVSDNGRGVPVDVHPKFKKSALELIFTTLHAGGKFSDSNYQSAGGLHGVGASVVNALSSELTARVCREGYEWSQSFSRGKSQSKLSRGKRSKEHGTEVFFRPDPEIFRSVRFSAPRLRDTIREKAFLNKGITFEFCNEVSGESERFLYREGLRAYLKSLLEGFGLRPIGEELFYFERENGLRVELAFCWTEATNTKLLSYVNGIATRDGGTHEDGFRSGLTKAVRNYMNVHDLVPKGVKITAEDIREGLIAVLSVTVPGSVTELQFQGQTKDRLNNPEITAPVDSITRTLENTLNTKASVSSVVIERVVLAARARAAARTASQSVSRKVGVTHRLNLPGKLADCSSNRPNQSELFIVEGDSAGGTAKQARDRKTQAVFPLKGKILNAFAASDSKLKENKELVDLVSVLGCGLGDQFKIDRLRYGKIVVLTDADADGMHIASLLMAFFYRYLKQLIEAGHLYVGLSPLYRIRLGSGEKEKLHWVYTDEEKERLLNGRRGGQKAHVTRFKGLGEMNPSTLWDTALNPKTRNLLRIQIDDDLETRATLQGLLGKDSSDRYRLIQENAHRLELDL